MDALSKGRLTVGIGGGYLATERRALGASLADRGSRADEFLLAMQALWTDSAPTFSGRFVSFTGMVQRPLPTQRPHPPLVIGGNSVSAHRRAVRVGNGWYGWATHLHQAGAADAPL